MIPNTNESDDEIPPASPFGHSTSNQERSIARRLSFMETYADAQNFCMCCKPERVEEGYQICNHHVLSPQMRMFPCSMNGCRNNFFFKNIECCRVKPSIEDPTDPSREYNPMNDFVCLPCYTILFDENDSEGNHGTLPSTANSEGSNNTTADNLSNIKNNIAVAAALARLGIPLRNEGSANDVHERNKNQRDMLLRNSNKSDSINKRNRNEEQFLELTKVLHVMLGDLQSERYFVRNQHFEYLLGSNNKFHMNHLRNSLIRLIEKIENNIRCSSERNQGIDEEERINGRVQNAILIAQTIVHLSVNLQIANSIIVFGEKNDSNCAICLAELTQVDISTTLPCGHSYHDECFNNLLQRQDSAAACPTCRAPFLFENLIDS